MSEEWRPVPGLPLLEASSAGRIRSLPYDMVMPNGGTYTRQMAPTLGHLTAPGTYRRFQINFRRKSYMVAPLVCTAFHGLPPFKGAEAMHKNENSLDNREDNLEWGTRKENANAPAYLEYCRTIGIKNLQGRAP